MFDFSFSQLITSMLFSSTGFVLFVYGKKTTRWKVMCGGIALSVLPYVVRQTLALWVGGALIIAALYVFRD